jgi:hypothetical protein
MKAISVSRRAKTLNELLKKARRGTIILESADGQRFALTSVDDWDGFDVGSDRDFAREVERTGQNKKLMKSLAARRKSSRAGSIPRGIPLAEAKKQLDLN